jgi:aerobic carbon-monoxide dehydrogenase small subunit
MNVKITINGKQYEDDVEPRFLLVHYIREKAKQNGTHVGCDTASCGACTVLLNGEPIKSCVMLAVQADGANITTIEGVSVTGLHPVQQAFIEKFGFQCGYCTSGMIISSVALLKRNPNPSDHEIREALEGNLCMCTGYQQIVESIQHAAKLMSAAAKAPEPREEPVSVGR